MGTREQVTDLAGAMLKEPPGVEVSGTEGKLAENEFEGVVVTAPRHASTRIIRIRSRELTALSQHPLNSPSLARASAAPADGWVYRADPLRALPARAPRRPSPGTA